MDNFGAYMMAQEKSARRFAELGQAGAHYDNAKIWERLMEVRSQHEPCTAMLQSSTPSREMLYAIAHYVVTGRMPDPVAK